MNQQIQQLKLRAGIGDNPDQEGLDLFAELIAREAADIAYQAYWDNPETVRGMHIKEKIKQHFGVEE